MTKKLLQDIETISSHVCRMPHNSKAAKQMAEAAAILTACYVQLKEVELHEKFHLQENTLPGENVDLTGMN